MLQMGSLTDTVQNSIERFVGQFTISFLQKAIVMYHRFRCVSPQIKSAPCTIICCTIRVLYPAYHFQENSSRSSA